MRAAPGEAPSCRAARPLKHHRQPWRAGKRTLAARAVPIAEFASFGDLVTNVSSSLAASTPGPLSSLVSTLGNDLAMTVDLQPSAVGLGRLAVRLDMLVLSVEPCA